MLEDPIAWHYGLGICEATGIAPGTIYPVLAALEKAGWLESRWDYVPRNKVQRRRLYRLTGLGQQVASVAAIEAPPAHAAPKRRRYGFGFAQPQGQLG